MSRLTPEEVFKARVVVPRTTLVRELPEGRSVILSMASERYFSLDRTGSDMWAALTSGSVEDAFRHLRAEYDVEEDQLRADLRDFVEELVTRELVELDTA